MSWVCDVCNSNNSDSERECFVCGAPKPTRSSSASSSHARSTSTPTPTPARSSSSSASTSASTSSSAHSTRRHRESWIKHVFSEIGEFLSGLDSNIVALVLLGVAVLISFAIGQTLLYVFYQKTGGIFLLSRLVRTAGAYHFKTTVFAIITSVIAFLAGAGLIVECVYTVVEEEDDLIYPIVWVVAYALSMIIFPTMSALVWVVIDIGIAVAIYTYEFEAVTIATPIAVVLVFVAFIAAWCAVGNSMTVRFDTQGGEYSKTQVYAKEGGYLPTITYSPPKKVGYTFLGFYDDPYFGNQYYDADMQGVRNWDKKRNTVLYAHWDANICKIILERMGGTGGTALVTTLYDSWLPDAVAPTRNGYTFEGYYDDRYEGKQYYDADMHCLSTWDSIDTTLYAHWVMGGSKIRLNKEGGEGGTRVVVASFSREMPEATAPTRAGFTFKGYFSQPNGEGDCYYDEEMNSVRYWDKADKETRLFAHWESNLEIVLLSDRTYNISDFRMAIFAENGTGRYEYKVIGSPLGAICEFEDNILHIQKTINGVGGFVTVWVRDFLTGATATATIQYTTSS